MRIAALDLGSNSFHLLVVDAHPDGTFVPIVREKEMLRLGDVVSREGRITEAAAERVVATIRRFHTLAEAAGAHEFVAKATSAIREADNGGALIDHIFEETGIRIAVISGREEARLIFGAIRASVVLDPGPALCFDLGGGSLEVMVGDTSGLAWSDSVHLGVARLTAELVAGDPPSSDDRRRLSERLTSHLLPVAEQVTDFAPRLAVGSSGTLCDLARMVAAHRDGTVPVSVNHLRVGRDDLLEIHDKVLSMTSAERARLPGLEPRRADLVPAGSMFLVTAMELFGFDEMVMSEWALREGIVLDAIGHHDPVDWSDDDHDIRRASVIGLARRCNWDEAHARHVAQLAVSLFDQTLPIHKLGDDDRELLEHAALLHDIGEHVSAESHHKHTAYLIQHGRLRGYAPDEVLALAALARYHRRSEPKPSHEPFRVLADDAQERVRVLAGILRVADGLDASHGQTIDGVDVEREEALLRLRVHARGDCDVELWGARRKRGLLEKTVGRKVEVVAFASH
jgi:exopolyphosphatase / guanosine-5'-triphosphate,3'-diphosphate pyrophosphatase